MNRRDALKAVGLSPMLALAPGLPVENTDRKLLGWVMNPSCWFNSEVYDGLQSCGTVIAKPIQEILRGGWDTRCFEDKTFFPVSLQPHPGQQPTAWAVFETHETAGELIRCFLEGEHLLSDGRSLTAQQCAKKFRELELGAPKINSVSDVTPLYKISV